MEIPRTRPVPASPSRPDVAGLVMEGTAPSGPTGMAFDDAVDDVAIPRRVAEMDVLTLQMVPEA